MGVCLAFHFNLLAMFRPTCRILGSTLICILLLYWSVCPQAVAGDPATMPQRPPPAPFSAAPLVGAASALAPPLGSLPRTLAALQVAQVPAAASPAVVAGPPASAAAPATDASAAGAGLCSAAVQQNLDLQQAWSHAWHLDSQPSELKSGGKFFESLTATTLCSESLGCSTRTRSVSENQGIAFLCTQWVHACGFFSK
jgi:hypothetical protein